MVGLATYQVVKLRTFSKNSNSFDLQVWFWKNRCQDDFKKAVHIFCKDRRRLTSTNDVVVVVDVERPRNVAVASAAAAAALSSYPFIQG